MMASLRLWSVFPAVLVSFTVLDVEAHASNSPCGGPGQRDCKEYVALCVGLVAAWVVVFCACPFLTFHLFRLMGCYGCCRTRSDGWWELRSHNKAILVAVPQASPSRIQPAIQQAPQGGFSQPKIPLQGVSVLAVKRLTASSKSDSVQGAPVCLPHSGRYIGTCAGPFTSQSLLYSLHFKRDGSISGTCAAEVESPLEVSGYYDSGAQLYRWAEVTDIACEHHSKQANPKAYAEELLKSGVFHVEVEMRVHKRDHLEGQYFTTMGTQGSLILEARDV